jgi:hypothetical protein
MLFDTQKMVERLEGVGAPAAQARMHTVLLSEAISALDAAIVERCASKEDLARLKDYFEIRFAEIKSDRADLKSELIKWVVSVGILQTAFIGALLLKLVP